jgi:TolB-like protein/tetratricopeptide (TPR) repeat protein
MGYRFIAPVSRIDTVAPVSAVEVDGRRPVTAHPERPPSSERPAPPARTMRARVALGALVIAVALGAWWVAVHLSPAPPVRSLAVIPLENLGAPSQQFFADGITDALITRLAKLRDVRVISRTSSMHYQGVRRRLPDIARELNVDAVVEGTITRAGNRVRVTAQLVDARRDRHLWADEFDRDVTDILSVQREVADSIARAVRTTLVETRTPAGVVDAAAYDHYLRGRSFWNQRTEEGLAQAVSEFEQAISLDASYAEAYAGLADAYTALGYTSYRSPADTFPRAGDAARHALALDPGVAEAQASLGYVALYHDWDWAAAEAAFKAAIALNPNYATAHHWYSVFLTAVGRQAEAVAEIERARQLDPLSVPIATDIGFELYYARRHDEATTELRKVLQGSPKFPLAHLWLGRCYEARGMYGEAVAEYEQTGASLADWPVTIAAAGHTLGRAGRMAEARASLARLEALASRRYVTPYGMALVYDGLGDRANALDWLERAFADRSHWLVWLALDPRFDDLRAEPRFKGIIGRMRFP